MNVFQCCPFSPKAFCFCLQVDLRPSQHRSIEVRIPSFIRLSKQQVVSWQEDSQSYTFLAIHCWLCIICSVWVIFKGYLLYCFENFTHTLSDHWVKAGVNSSSKYVPETRAAVIHFFPHTWVLPCASVKQECALVWITRQNKLKSISEKPTKPHS